MRVFIAAAAVLFAGCITHEPQEPSEPADLLSCPEYPDSTPVDCTSNLLRTAGVAASSPGVETGWMCVLRNRNDAGFGVFDFYVHQDGRMAYAWDLNIARPDGALVVHGSVYQEGGSQFIVAPYQSKGFAVFDEKKKGDTAHVHLLARQFRLDQKVGAEWTPLPVSLIVGEHKRDAWYVLEFDAGQGPEYVAPMRAGEAPRPYEPDDTLVTLDDRQIFVDVWVTGAKFPNANIAWPSVGNSRCSL